MQGDNRENFGATSGKVFGTIGIAVGVGFVVTGVIGSGVSWEGLSFGVLLVVLSWVTLLRPSVTVDHGDLILRGMLATTTIPLGAIEQVSVRQVLTVLASDRKYTSPAVGRGRREMFREQVSGPGSRGGGGGILSGPGAIGGAIGAEEGNLEGVSYGLFVETRLRTLATDVRKDAGIRAGSAEQDALAEGITRTWAWPEVVAVALAVVAVALAFVL